jgi:D-alanyl-D-alanine carboxypeptidase
MSKKTAQRPALWRRIMRGCTITLAAAGLILLAGGIWQRHALIALAANLQAIVAEPQYAQGLEEPAEILALLQNRRDHVALVSYRVLPDGSIDHEQPVISHNADQPLPLASTIKILLLAAYAEQVEQGRLQPDQPVMLADWQRYYLPGTDGGAHQASLQQLGITTDEAGFALDPAQRVPLDELVRAMIVESDNAAADYLLDRIGLAAMRDVIERAGLEQQSLPLSSLGMFLSWRNHEQPRQQHERIEHLAALSTVEYRREVEWRKELYVTTGWAQAERDWRSNASLPDLTFQAAATSLLAPRGSAADYARIMAGIANDSFISPAVAQRMRSYLNWPMQFAGNQARFRDFAAKGGSLPGLITEAFYVVPREGDFADQQRVVVLFMPELPLSAFLRLNQTFGHQGFMLQLAEDAAFAEEVRQTLQ